MDCAATPFESLTEAVKVTGSQAAFARMCGVSQPAVWKWLQAGKHLPAEYVLTVERETGISRHLLRPDIYPLDQSSPSLDGGSIAGGAPIVPSDRGVVSDRGDA